MPNRYELDMMLAEAEAFIADVMDEFYDQASGGYEDTEVDNADITDTENYTV